ncbi:MAG: tryptophan--tRNA ligase [Campylobacterota bacterium]|nr:tryptophan--tRNA ligase [Campylobacterota bacterium]
MDRVLSGMRPTGNLHLGNLYGALNNWIKLQNENYQTFYFVADFHALTTDFAHSTHLKEETMNMAIDWFSFGLSPEKSTIFVQSKIKEHAELFTIFSMITPVSWLERNPSYKDVISQIGEKSAGNFGFLGYPVLMTADITMYKARYVPVGFDQLPHLELAREIVRRFNYLTKKDVFLEPQALLSTAPKILGIDGRKMSKSYGNAIYLSDNEEETRKKIKGMFTDPQRLRKNDAGRPDMCGVFYLHQIFSDKQKIKEIEEGCKNASIGCVDCKNILIKNINEKLRSYREKRTIWEKRKEDILSIFEEGARKARQESEKTMEEAREAVFG